MITKRVDQFLKFIRKGCNKLDDWLMPQMKNIALPFDSWAEYYKQLGLVIPIRNTFRVMIDKIEDGLQWLIFWTYEFECWRRPKNILKIDMLPKTSPFSFDIHIIKTVLDLFEQSMNKSYLLEMVDKYPEEYKDNKDSLEVCEIYKWYMENKESIKENWDNNEHLPKVLRLIELKDCIG